MISNIKLKSKLIIILGVCLASIVILYFFLNTKCVLYGSYDPQNKLLDNSNLQITHLFVDWNNADWNQINQQIKQDSVKRLVLLTVEPWENNCSLNKCELSQDIQNGRFDSTIDGMCSLGQSPDLPVLIRWGHEMDNIGRYPWSGMDPKEYISVYQYVVNRCKKNPNNIRWVWSPAGNENATQYWPGKDYANYIGLSIFHYPEYEMKHWNSTYSLRELFEPKYNRLKNLGRPIIIAELGVSGSLYDQHNWLKKAQEEMGRFLLLRGVVYFNDSEKNSWDPSLPLPNWTTNKFPVNTNILMSLVNSTLKKFKIQKFLEN